MADLFPIVFLFLVVLAILSGCGEITMRIRLTKRELRSEKLMWWRRGGDEVASTYQELFPHSIIPRFRVFTFWLFLIFAATLLVLIVWKRS